MTSSIVLPAQYKYNDIFPESIFSSVTQTTGCGNSKSPVQCMRAVSADVLQQANDAAVNSGFYKTSVFVSVALFRPSFVIDNRDYHKVPVIDGTFIIERPSQTLLRGAVNGNATYVVSNVHEGLTFALPNSTVANFVAQLLPLLSESQVSQVVNMYEDGFDSDDERNQAIVGEWTFICPSYFFVNAFGGRGYRVSGKRYWNT